MNYYDFSIDKIDEIPEVRWSDKDNTKYDFIIIVPNDKIHESGYMCMTFLFCKDDEIICKSQGCSDVLHIDGIGGYGLWYPGEIPDSISPRAWSIDCLPNGYLRLFCSNKKIKNGNGISDYGVFAIDKE